MQIPIVVENLGPDHYRAEASSPIGLTAEGTSSADAIQNLRTRIEEEFSNGRWIVMLDLPDENPWIQHAGQLRDESFLEDFQSALNEYRRQRDPDDA